MRKVIIIGSGPAGLTAGIYTGRANLKPLLIEGLHIGGQLALTDKIENFPGFPEGIEGIELIDRMRKQAEEFGCEVRRGVVERVNFRDYPFSIFFNGYEEKTLSVIVATGASPRFLGLKDEKKFIGRGISTCATCDGFFFRDKEIALVGGGDSAMEESLFLTKFAKKVTIIHRRGEFRASKIMQERVRNNKKIEILWNSVITEILSDDGETLGGLKIKDVQTGEEKNFKTDGLFLAIGHNPNTEIFKGQIEINEMGYIILKEKTMTSVRGVFAAGDVVDHRYRQAITSAGMGCMAAIDAEKFLEPLDTNSILQTTQNEL